MTIKSKFNKLIAHPTAFKDYFRKVSPDHTASFIRARKLMDNEIKTFIDVGANIGSFVKAGLYYNSDMEIIAFEPVPNIFQFESYTKRVKFFDVGLSNKKNLKDFYINKVSSAWSTFHKPVKNHSTDFSRIETFKKIKIKLDRFDNLNLEIKRPCFLKVDVEGNEHEALEGFGDRLNEVDVIQLEHCFRNYFSGQKNMGDTFNLLKKYGFNGIIQLNNRYVNGKLTFCDWMFFRIKN